MRGEGRFQGAQPSGARGREGELRMAEMKEHSYMARKRAVLAAVLAAALALLIAPQVAGALYWSNTSSQINAHIYTYSVSCPSASLCVGGADEGRILSSTNPTSSASWS